MKTIREVWIRWLKSLTILLIGIGIGAVMAKAADNVVLQNGALTQKSQQNLNAPLKATDNGDGTWTLAVNAATMPSTFAVTPTITTASSSGTVASGSRGVTFIFSSDFTGTILGATFTGSVDDLIRILPPAGSTFGVAVPYTITTGSARIVDIR